MQANPLAELLKLPPSDRAELAMALWESLSDAERESEFDLTADQRAELDRRWVEHREHPESAVPWTEVRRKLQDVVVLSVHGRRHPSRWQTRA